MKIRLITALLSLLIATCGWFGHKTLVGVDHDLRVIYAEYTLAAADLGHVSGELIRYRTSVIRAIEASSQEDFTRILDSLPHKRERVEKVIERFIQASNDASQGLRMDARELVELKAVQEKIEEYMNSSRRALQLMEQRWEVVPEFQARRLQGKAKEYLSKDAGTKYMNVTFELDRLLEVVGEIAGEVRKDADSTLRTVTAVLIAVSVVLSFLVLAVPTQRN
jgi:hypothetical protein